MNTLLSTDAPDVDCKAVGEVTLGYVEGRIEDALGRLNEELSLLTALADSLLGAEPEEPDGCIEKLGNANPGKMRTLDATVDRLHMRISMLGRQTKRLSGVLK